MSAFFLLKKLSHSAECLSESLSDGASDRYRIRRTQCFNLNLAIQYHLDFSWRSSGDGNKS
jgi:hypothetical protein